MLIETFVETPRYTGTVYRASGWTRVGTTQGRGRCDRLTKRAQPKKGIWFAGQRHPLGSTASRPDGTVTQELRATWLAGGDGETGKSGFGLLPQILGVNSGSLH